MCEVLLFVSNNGQKKEEIFDKELKSLPFTKKIVREESITKIGKEGDITVGVVRVRIEVKERFDVDISSLKRKELLEFVKDIIKKEKQPKLAESILDMKLVDDISVSMME